MSLEQKLQQLISSSSNKNVLNHFQELFSQILQSRQKAQQSPSDNLFQKFEDLSLMIKTKPSENPPLIREPYSDLQEYLNQLKTLLIKQQVEGEEEKEQGVLGYVPNLIEEMRIFEKIGISFGEEEHYILFKSLTKFSAQRNAKQVRLWGKIYCSVKDYYIIETVVDGIDEGELPPGTEPRGSGVNKYTYFANTDLLGDWTELPLVNPDQIKAARQIKYLFTGNLEKQVITNPFFPGKEKNLLRAQIARISFSTQLVATGIYKVNEEDPKQIDLIEVDENYKAATFEQLSQLENWHHICENILNEGRLVHNKPEIPEGEDEEVFMKKIEANDPFEPRLKSISKDKSKEGLQQAWVLQVAGDSSYYLTQDGKKSKNNGIIFLRSMIWKGFNIVYQDKLQQSLYIGHGFKSDLKIFYPKAPQVMIDEPEDKVEQHEPREAKNEQQQDIKQDDEQ